MAKEIICSNFNYEKNLLAPYKHILQVQGKGLRVKFIRAFNHWLKVPADKDKHILDILNMGYNTCLLYDDIQDNSIVRRGSPAAHCVYGVPLTMATCIHLHFLIYKKLMEFNFEAAKIYTEDMLICSIGQEQDIYWRENFVCPTETEYKEMIKRSKYYKNYAVVADLGSVLRLSVRIMQLYSEDKRDYTNLIFLFALYFQIKDDYCNLTHPEALEEWPSIADDQPQQVSFCEDLTEGKFTLTIIHALKTAESVKINNILRKRTRDVAMKKYCKSLLEKAGSFQYTRDTLWALDKEIREELSHLGGNPEMEAVLDELLIWQKS